MARGSAWVPAERSEECACFLSGHPTSPLEAGVDESWVKHATLGSSLGEGPAAAVLGTPICQGAHTEFYIAP